MNPNPSPYTDEMRDVLIKDLRRRIGAKIEETKQELDHALRNILDWPEGKDVQSSLKHAELFVGDLNRCLRMVDRGDLKFAYLALGGSAVSALEAMPAAPEVETRG